MAFRPALWRPIALVATGINLVGLGWAVAAAEPWHAAAHAALAFAFGVWAQRLRRGPGGTDLARMQEEMEEQSAALEDARTTLAAQSSQIAELEERLDFAERLLAQARDRPLLDLREKRDEPR